MNSPLPYPLDRFEQMPYGPVSAKEQARRNRADFAETCRRGDADVADFERSQALRIRADRRQKRATECRSTALVCFVAMALLVGPTMLAKWPGETLLVAAAVSAVAGIVRGAKSGNPEW